MIVCSPRCDLLLPIGTDINSEASQLNHKFLSVGTVFINRSFTMFLLNSLCLIF
ncbi:hypothetical protein CCAN2_1340002 [Capnocytophaga canimorsus]|nr:hypothetical protein CCAN2_1340002 [Capnocytophaga canimorsus]